MTTRLDFKKSDFPLEGKSQVDWRLSRVHFIRTGEKEPYASSAGAPDVPEEPSQVHDWPAG